MEDHIQCRREDDGIPALRLMKSKPLPDEIMQTSKSMVIGNEKQVRQLGIYLCHKHSGMKLKEIGDIFGMRESAICGASRRIRIKIEQDAVLQKQVEKIKGGLKI